MQQLDIVVRGGWRRWRRWTSNPSNPAGCPAWNQSVGPGGSTGVALTATSTPVTCQYYCMIHAPPTTGAMRASITAQ